MGGVLLRIQDCFGGYFPLTFNLGCHIKSFWCFSQASPLLPSVSSFATQVFTTRSGLPSSNLGLHIALEMSFCCSLRHSSSPSSPSIVMSSPSSISLDMSAPISIEWLFLYSIVICICVYSHFPHNVII